MNKTLVVIVFGFVIITGLLILQTSIESASVVMLPSHLLTKGPTETLRRIRVAGTISASAVDYEVEPEIFLRFSIEERGKPNSEVPVVYQGLKPDMFAPGRDVIIDGEFSRGVLHANKLLTQCPSKYEPPVSQTRMNEFSREAEG